MDKERLIMKTGQALHPFETQNVLTFLKELNMKSLTNHPEVTFPLVLALLYALWRWTRIVLLTLFTLLSLTMLIRYTLPPSGAELTISSTLPFILGCMGIASVLLYFSFLRTD